MALGLMACAAESDPIPAPDPVPAPELKPEEEPANLVGISMPTNELQRWNQDGDNMKKQLEAADYEVDLQYAQNDVSMQISQIKKMIANGARVLVVSAIDGEALGTILAQAKEADVAGDPGYSCMPLPLFSGAMAALQPYVDSGILVCQSGQTEMMEVTTENWDAAKAQERFENILSTYYADKPLHANMASNDSTAQGAATALASSYSNEVYPIITGQDCDIVSVQNILDGKQAMSVFKDTRTLAAQAAKMVDAIMQGGEPEINDTETYDNDSSKDGVNIIPSYLCEPVACDITNYEELLIESGYYTMEQLAG